MKKLILLLIIGMLLIFTVVECSNSEKYREYRNLRNVTNEPTYVVQSFIKAINDYEYTATYDLFTTGFQEQYSMISDFINQSKLYNKVDAEKGEKEPDVIKITSDKAGIWYMYDTKEYVYYELIKEKE